MSYNRALVEHLLPAVWDKYAAYGVRNPYEPDADMPKAKPNPKNGNTLVAHLADIRTAWEKTPLSLDERRALLLHYGMDLTEGETAKILGSPRTTVQHRIAAGVGRMTAWLNGDEYREHYDNDDTNEVAA